MKFPPKPNLIDSSITKPSKEFIVETYKVCFAILLFVITYIILLAIGIALAIGAGYLGYLLVISYPRIVTIMIGIALCIFGLFIIFFLFKFIGSTNEQDISHLHEIKSADEPELFQFIQRVVDEVGSDFPKKIYLSNEVNAYVFYNSNFLSLFFPVRKNLVIGLGLINSIDMSEFKAILAHEFGHFSQKSMKLGSYIYYVNRVIHNMLYDNDSLERSVSKVSESNVYLALAGALTFLVVRIIQYILKLVYKPINTMYMSLSRQMEFHADAVAASVSGGNHLISSLRRLEMSDICYNTLMSNYNEWGFDNFRSNNIYLNHKEVQKHYASDHDLKFDNYNIDTSDYNHLIIESRIEVKDQWASHPTLEQRTRKLNSLNLVTDSVNESPWRLFRSSVDTQEKFTKKLFDNLSSVKESKILSNEDFKQKYYASFSEIDIPKEYFGFFDNYFPTEIEFSEIEKFQNETPIEEILNKKEVKKLKDSQSIYNDLYLLQYIMDGNSGIKSFDFDGKKYSSKKANEVYKIIENDSIAISSKFRNTAKSIFKHFYSKANEKGNGQKYRSMYNYLVSELKKYDEDLAIYNSIQTELEPIYQDNVPIKLAEKINKNIKDIEVRFKEMLQNKISTDELHEEDFDLYLQMKGNYFSVDTFNEKNLEILITALNRFVEKQNLRLTKLKKEFLEYQIKLETIANV